MKITIKNHKNKEENKSRSKSEEEYENMGNIIFRRNNNRLRNLRQSRKHKNRN